VHRILLLNQYFPPDGSATAALAQTIVEALSKGGYDLRVIAGRPSYDLQTRHGILESTLREHKNVRVERVWSTARSRRRMSGRVMNYLSYMFFAALRAVGTKAEVVVAMTDPPIVGSLGALVSVIRGTPFIYNIQDLHPEMALASGMIKRGCLVKLWSRLQLETMRRAKLIVTPGFDMRARIAAKGVPRGKIMVVRHGTETMPAPPDRHDPVVKELRQGFGFTLVHAGNLGLYGAWKTIVEAARNLEEKDVGVIFIGTGAAEKEIRELAEHCNNVRFLPYLPAEQIPHVMAAGDLHVVTIRRGFEGLVVPSKLYTILAAGKPVLVAADETSDAARLVTEYGCGMVVSPDDPNGMSDAISLLMGDHERLDTMGRLALELSGHLSRGQYLQLFVDAVRMVSSKGGRQKVDALSNRLAGRVGTMSWEKKIKTE
jgi:colanic acid biosynthesis glycosyl transferase WcaI